MQSKDFIIKASQSLPIKDKLYECQVVDVDVVLFEILTRHNTKWGLANFHISKRELFFLFHELFIHFTPFYIPPL